MLISVSSRIICKEMEFLPKRFGKYGLTIHPEKIQLIDFNKPKTQEGSEECLSG